MQKFDWKKTLGLLAFLAFFGGVSWCIVYQMTMMRLFSTAWSEEFSFVYFFGLAVTCFTALFMLFQAILVAFYKPAKIY